MNPKSTSTLTSTVQAGGKQGRLLTDYPTRVFHALFALCFVGAYLTADSEHWRLVHVTLGYSCAFLLGFRLLYGFIGPHSMSWQALWTKLANSPVWLKSATWQIRRKWLNQGLSVTQSWFVVAALACVLPIVITGHLQFNEIGPEWWLNALEEVHEFVANGLGLLALGHVALMALTSWVRKQNHALLMWSGRIPEKGPDLITHPRKIAAIALMASMLVFVTWIWNAVG